MIWRFTPQKVRRFLFIRAKLLQKCLRRSICIVCSQELRAFFVEHIGKGFHFKAEFQDWLHNNAGKTFREAVGVGVGRNVNRIRTDIISRILMQ